MKNKTHLTRKNLIAIALVFFYAFAILLAALAIDGNNPLFAKNNPIQELARSLFVLKTLDGRIVNGVPLGSFPAYALILLASWLIISLDGFSVTTNFSAVVSCFNNIGPGLEAVGPTCNYAGYSVLSKLVLIFDMLAGRLEILPMLALCSTSTWRRR